MIGQLTGKVVSSHPPVLVLEVGGVGYELNAPMGVFFNLPAVEEKVTLFTHLVVREDAHTLFGFLALTERQWFRELIKISGVGPRMALAILSTMSAVELVTVIVNGEASVLQKVPGVGKKTAERLVIELQDKGCKWLSSQEGLDVSRQSGVGVTQRHQAEQDAQYALVALGYKPAEASRALKRIEGSSLSSEELIKRALKEMVQV